MLTDRYIQRRTMEEVVSEAPNVARRSLGLEALLLNMIDFQIQVRYYEDVDLNGHFSHTAYGRLPRRILVAMLLGAVQWPSSATAQNLISRYTRSYFQKYGFPEQHKLSRALAQGLYDTETRVATARTHSSTTLTIFVH